MLYGHLDPAPMHVESPATDIGLARAGVGVRPDDGSLEDWRLVFYETSPIEGVHVGVVQARGRRNAMLATDMRALDVGRVEVARRFPLVGPLSLVARAQGTLSLEQSTALAEVPSPELRGCSSQSELDLAVGVAVADRVEIVAVAMAQEDPLHFDTGEDCLGGPPAWMKGRRLGVEAAWRPTGDLTLFAVVQDELYAVSYELPTYGTHSTERLSGWIRVDAHF